MSNSNGSLSPKKLKAIHAIIVAPNLKSAAESIGVGYRTLRRWMKEPEFIGQLNQAELELIESGLRRLLTLQDKAFKTLTELLDSPNDFARHKACLTVLSQMHKYRELYVIEHKLNELEESLETPGY